MLQHVRIEITFNVCQIAIVNLFLQLKYKKKIVSALKKIFESTFLICSIIKNIYTKISNDAGIMLIKITLFSNLFAFLFF